MRVIAAVGTAALLMVTAVPWQPGRAEAQDLPATARAAAPGWEFHVAPYGWMASLSGTLDAGPRVPPAKVDLSFGDILENLDAGLMIAGFARHDRFVMYGDFAWVGLSASAAVTTPLPISGTANVDLVFGTLAAGYRVVQEPHFYVDVVAGARAWEISGKANLRFAGTPVENPSFTMSWVDPVIGAHAAIRIAPNWSIMLEADVGGFGVGSRFSWQALATVNYSFNDWLSGAVGYRHLDVNYQSNGQVFDAYVTGPIMGLVFRF